MRHAGEIAGARGWASSVGGDDGAGLDPQPLSSSGPGLVSEAPGPRQSSRAHPRTPTLGGPPASSRLPATMSTPTTLPLTYRSLLQVRGLPRVMVAALLGRIGGQMESVALVLFALQHFHSPAIAGVTVFAYAFPGVLFSPLAGAILDRRGRATLIMFDYSVAAVAMVAIVGLGQAGVLSAGLLIGIAALSSVTGPLSGAGTRTLFPMLVPRHLWDRANAVDSAGVV